MRDMRLVVFGWFGWFGVDWKVICGRVGNLAEFGCGPLEESPSVVAAGGSNSL